MLPFRLRCTACATEYPATEIRYRCDCRETLDVVHASPTLPASKAVDPGSAWRAVFDARLASKDALDRSGVWRFRELVLPLDPSHIVTRGEGRTNLHDAQALADWVGLERLRLKHEGENPTGSFKDRGMTTAVSMARSLGLTRVACASTGNTSASMASYAAVAGMRAYVFIPEGKIAYGKLSQSLAYGARTIQIAGDFDAAMALVERVCADRGIYLLNSVNPFRLEGQKAIGIDLLQDLDWHVPDWIVVPGGNLGNNSAIYKGLSEMLALGIIDRLPRIAIVQAAGANPLYRAFRARLNHVPPVEGARTIATAIQIGNPVSWRKSLRAVRETNGLVEEVGDQEIMDAKAKVDAAGIGAEPASCATVAGLRKLIAAGAIARSESVVAVLTGHILKDPDATVNYHRNALAGVRGTFANAPVQSAAELDAVLAAMG